MHTNIGLTPYVCCSGILVCCLLLVFVCVWICHRQFIDLFLLPVCTVDSSQTCVALGSITYVVEMFIYIYIYIYIYIEFPHNSLSVPLHVSSIIPSCFVCFNIPVFCLIFAARMQIMDCFMYVS